ncbi:MAG: hypothetical protein HYY13_10685 [Nitrospirae bacterium]|nr:hypothetical protein [Nitrospirota bacterium]
MSTDVAELIRRIQGLPHDKKRELMQILPSVLDIDPEDMAWLKASEPSFQFWDNPEDEIYDRLPTR